MRTRAARIWLVALALVLGSGAGLAFAGIPGSDGTITACYDKKGNLRVVDASAGDTCAKGEKPLSWSQQGPPGAPGAPGAPGEPGPAGPPGPGLASLDDLSGLPCRVGKPGEGTLEVGYAAVDGTGRDVVLRCKAGTLHTLTVTKPTGGTIAGGPIECGDTCAAPFSPEAVVDLTATPASGYRFAGWTGACSGTGTCHVDMGEDQTVGADFVRQYTLNVTASATGFLSNAELTVTPSRGAFTPNPCRAVNSTVTCTATYDQGTTVTLTASGTLTNLAWSGDCSGSSVTCTLTMDQSRAVGVQVSRLF